MSKDFLPRKMGGDLGMEMDSGALMAQHTFGGAQRYLSIFILYFCVNYNDLTATSLESWFIREIIPKWP